MNKIDFKEGGFPLNTDTLEFMQAAYSKSIKALAAIGGDNYILTGCEESISAASDGFVVINGELLPFKGGTKKESVLIREEKNAATYEDGNEKDSYFTRWVEFGKKVGVSPIAWASLARIDNLQAMASDFTKQLSEIVATKSPMGHKHSWSELQSKPSSFPPSTHSHSWTETTGKPSTFPPSSHGHTWSKISGKPSTFPASSHTHSSEIPQGLICMWSGSSTPSGWALCNGSNGTPDLRNRFIVGSGGEYSTKNTGGAKSVSLTKEQMPSHNHTARSNSTGGHNHSITGGSHSHAYKDIYYNEDSNHDDARSGSVYGYEYIEKGMGSGDSDTNNNRAFYKKRTTSSATHTHTIGSVGNHSHSISIDSSGSSKAHENRPPYYALAFIMKL